MNIEEQLKQIEREVSLKTNEAVNYMQAFYPISYNFMTQRERQVIDGIRKQVELLSYKYNNLLYEMPLEERNKYKYINLLGNFNSMVSSINGLEMVGPYSDEYELHSAFDKAYSFAKSALENIVNNQNNNQILLEKNNRVLKACNDVFDAHFWGETYKERLKKYDNRLRSGRTIDDDLKDYYNLVEDAKKLALEYAKAIKRGITELEKKHYNDEFNVIYDREKEILMFVPINMIENRINLHWLKLDAERKPDQVIEENEVKQNVI